MSNTVPEQQERAAARRRGPLAVFLGLAALVLLAVLAVACQSGRASAQPRLEVDRTEIDFGQVQVGKTVRASFELSNVGDQSLRLLGEPEVEVVEGC